MKYFFCAVVLLLILAVSCCAVVHRIAALTAETSAQLERAMQYLSEERFEDATMLITQAHADWLAGKGFWSSVLRHSETDDLGYEFEELLQKLPFKDTGELIPQLAVLRARLQHLAQMEQAFYYNFL